MNVKLCGSCGKDYELCPCLQEEVCKCFFCEVEDEFELLAAEDEAYYTQPEIFGIPGAGKTENEGDY